MTHMTNTTTATKTTYKATNGTTTETGFPCFTSAKAWGEANIDGTFQIFEARNGRYNRRPWTIVA